MDVISLTQHLLSFRTVNPPGDEHPCAADLAERLESAGLRVAMHELDVGRSSVVAVLPSRATRPAIAFTGHLDVVPLGATPWTVDPFGGEVRDGRLYGRGSADMKGAVAAMVVMAQRLAQNAQREADLQLIFTAGEERGCQGSQQLAMQPDALHPAGALVVGEPTGNQPLLGHKGCVRFELQARGVTAHASMPEEGDNAIFKAAEAALALRAFEFGIPAHPLLGRPTLNVGTFRGGMNINSVPDAATIGVDIRTVAGQDEDSLHRQLRDCVGPAIDIHRTEGAGAVLSDPADPWIAQVLETMADRHGSATRHGTAPYFTDAAFLKPALGEPPTLILGPGDAAMAHKTDEYCSVDMLRAAVEIYSEIAHRWCIAP